MKLPKKKLKNPPHPRTSYSPSRETWLEPEELCYPTGGKHRRCRARLSDGSYKVFRCGLPDTFFSTPVRKSDGDGYITIDDDDGEFIFRAHTRTNRGD